MQKRMLLVGLILVLALALGVTAYAEEAAKAHGSGFVDAVGGFLYNALPWNWGNWWGK